MSKFYQKPTAICTNCGNTRYLTDFTDEVLTTECKSCVTKFKNRMEELIKSSMTDSEKVSYYRKRSNYIGYIEITPEKKAFILDFYKDNFNVTIFNKFKAYTAIRGLFEDQYLERISRDTVTRVIRPLNLSRGKLIKSTNND